MTSGYISSELTLSRAFDELPPVDPKKPGKRGKPAKSEQRKVAVEKRLDRQVHQSATEAIMELPIACDRGTKKDTKGCKVALNGYKFHFDTNNTGLPISALVASASFHDTQTTIPLIKMTSGKVTYLYDLMDAAYDAKRIDETRRKLGHLPLTERNGRGQEVIPMAPHEAERYKIGSGAEMANSRLKEDFGASNVMVKENSNVTQHLMFGVITLFADQLLRLIEKIVK